MTNTVADDLPILKLADAAAWRAWLSEHHGDDKGIWLATADEALY